MNAGEAPQRESLPSSTEIANRPNLSPIILRFSNKYEALLVADENLSKWSEEKRRSRSEIDEQDSGVKTWQEAMRLAIDGWPDGRKRLKQTVHLTKRSVFERRPIRTFSYAGHVPIVPMYLNGDPEHMMSIGFHQKGKGRVYRIATSSQIDATTKRETVETWGGALLSVINQIENRGDYVELFWISMSEPCVSYRNETHNGPKIAISIKLKSATEILDINDLAFWLMHAAAQRRIQFAIKETLDIEKYYYNKFGLQSSDRDLFENLVGKKAYRFSVDRAAKSIDDAISCILKQVESNHLEL